MRHYLLLICILSFPLQLVFSQSIEQAWGLRFSPIGFSTADYCRVSVDSTQVTDDGFYPTRIKFFNKKVNTPKAVEKINRNDLDFENFWLPPKEKGCRFYWSRTVVLPVGAEENKCTVTLNCKSEIGSLRFIVVALDEKDNELYKDSVVISRKSRWKDYSLAFRQKGVTAVQIQIRYHGDVDANEGRSIYLNRIKISCGDQEINNLPIDSLVPQRDRKLHPGAIIPLSSESDASFAKIDDWKDKKIIALGEQVYGLRDLREISIQMMRHLIASENCKLILLELPEDLCVRWNLYLQGKQPDMYEEQLIKELKSGVAHPTIFFEFLKWVRRYNVKAEVPVRVIGIDKMDSFGFRNRRNVFLGEYLLKLSTNRQDSTYYVHAMSRHEYPQVKNYILQSQLPEILNEQDFQYLLFLMDELIRIHAQSLGTDVGKESTFDKVKRIGQVTDLYLSPGEKAVILASSKQINKQLSIRDIAYYESDSLGSYLYRKYGKQYHTVSIQAGERTCLTDTIVPDSATAVHYDKYGIRWAYPVEERCTFPFAFEEAGINSGIPYFYYSSSQLPKGILGLGLSLDYNIFRYCYIPSHFDALVFLREAKATHNFMRSYPSGLWEFIKDIGLHLDDLLKELKE